MTAKTREKLLIVDGARIENIATVGKPHNALVFGSGTSSDRTTTATADKNFIEFRFENSAASGDNRGIYNRLYLTTAGSGGESLRSFTTVEDVAGGTAHGAHISLNFNASGSITGLGVGMRATLHIPDVVMSGGTYAAIQAEIYAEGDTADISGTTNHSFIRFVAGGDATGAATIDTLFDLTGLPAAGDGDIVNTNATILAGSAYASLKVVLNGGVVKYLHLFDAS